MANHDDSRSVWSCEILSMSDFPCRAVILGCMSNQNVLSHRQVCQQLNMLYWLTSLQQGSDTVSCAGHTAKTMLIDAHQPR